MRVLLSTIGSRGDVQPLVALGLALETCGHEAHLCVPPDFRPWIESHGLTVTPIGPEVRHAARSMPVTPTLAAPPGDVRREMAKATVKAQFEAIDAAAQGCDVIVAATALQVAARSIAERRGMPYVFAAYTPSVLPSPHHAPPPLPPVPGQPPLPPAAGLGNRELWARDGARFNDLFRPALNAHRAALGLAPVDDVRAFMFTAHPWLAADPTLGPWPGSENVAVVQTGAWMLSDDRPLPADLEAFLDAGDPPIYFGFGSLRPPQDSSEVMARVAAARALGCRAILSRGWFDLAALDDARDCVVVGDVNLLALFRRAAAAVHHGGAGTTTLAALAGVPQVLVPQVYDQHYWAGQIEALGLGARVAGAAAADSLTAALDRTLQPAVAERARTLATSVRRDGATVAARRLIDGALL